MLDLVLLFGLDDFAAFRASLDDPHPDLRDRRLIPYLGAQFRRIGPHAVLGFGEVRKHEDAQLWSDFLAPMARDER